MQLLFESRDHNEIRNAKILLESRGIAVHINNATPVVPSAFYQQQIGLYVFYDEQYQDAVKLLQDETHEVSSSIDMSKHNSMLIQEDGRTTMQIIKWSIISLVGIIGLIVLLLYIGHYYWSRG